VLSVLTFTRAFGWLFDIDLALDTNRVINEILDGPKPVDPDLDVSWRELGVKFTDGGVEVDNTAPLAAIRAAITKAPVK
jgi:hypothetical protein